MAMITAMGSGSRHKQLGARIEMLGRRRDLKPTFCSGYERALEQWVSPPTEVVWAVMIGRRHRDSNGRFTTISATFSRIQLRIDTFPILS